MVHPNSPTLLACAALAAVLVAESPAHAFTSPPPAGSRRTCAHLVCTTVTATAPPPSSFQFNIITVLQEDDNWQREREELPETKNCILSNQGPEVPDHLLRHPDENVRFEAECFKNAMRGVYDGSVGLVGNACVGIYDRVRNPSRLAADAAMVWQALDEMAFVGVQTILEPEVQAQRVVNSCSRAAGTWEQLSANEKRRAAAELCHVLGELAGGAVGGSFAGAVRAGPGVSGLLGRMSQAVKARTRAGAVLPVVRSAGIFTQAGSKADIHIAVLNGTPVLVKVPKNLEAGETMQSAVAGFVDRFPAAQHGGFPGCYRGVVDIEVNGQKLPGVAMSEIPGPSFGQHPSAVKPVIRQSHVDSFREAIDQLRRDGRHFDDLHADNVMIGRDGRTYIIDNATLPRPPDPGDAWVYQNAEDRLLKAMEKAVKP